MNFKKIFFLILLAAVVISVPEPETLYLLTADTKLPLTLVIDAGHGGPDGGAEAADGTRESQLNLSMAKALKAECEKEGIKVMMTRRDEDGLYNEENPEKKWSKLEDMQCRKNFIDDAAADVVVTIHMNSFPADETVRGAQVFYPKTGNAEVLAESRKMAESVQSHLIQGLRDGSNRAAMGRGDVYLLENPRVPTVLIECGFLSNQEDVTRLKLQSYQQDVAKCILQGIRACRQIKIEKVDGMR